MGSLVRKWSHALPIPLPVHCPRLPSPLNRILEHYERRGTIAKAIVWGVSVVVVGLSLDYLVGMAGLPSLQERIIENTIEGALFTFFVWVVLKNRDEHLRRRFKEIGYLNHHIRNSLTAIEMAEGYISEPGQRHEVVKNASSRIRRCIEKISRNEDCEINQHLPQEP